jgi:hypothetical protein
LLRELRPEPQAEFVRDLESSLVARSRGRERFRVVAAGTALGASLVALTMVLGVLGLLPWSLGGSGRGEAKQECRTEVVVRHERRPVLVVDAKGNFRTVYRVTKVPRPVKRCP